MRPRAGRRAPALDKRASCAIDAGAAVAALVPTVMRLLCLPRQMLAWLRRRPVLVATPHGRLLLDPTDRLDMRLIGGRRHEPAQFARLRAEIAARPPDAFLDIGANLGLYALEAARAGVAEVHAFEPLARKAAQIAANAFANGMTERIRLHRTALGAAAGEADLHVTPGLTAVSRLETGQASANPNWSFADRERVPVARLDDVLDWRGRTVMVKIDVEGFERAVIAGMAGFLAANRVWLQIESFAETRAGLIADLAAAGYRECGHLGDDLYFEPMGGDAPTSRRAHEGS